MRPRLTAGLVPGIAPSRYHPVRTTLGTPLRRPPVHSGADMPLAASKYGRGAQIRSSSHFRGTLVAHGTNDRGL